MNIVMIAQINETVELVDHATKAGDRWMFIAALTVLLLFVGVVIKWLVRHIESKDERMEIKDVEHDAKLKAREEEARAERKLDQAAFLASLELRDAKLAANTSAIEKMADILTKHDQDMRAAHSVETRTIVHGELIRMGIDPAKLTHPGG